MTKKDLLKSIAVTGYNVGFGAKKHFATYDIVAKVPGFVGFVSIGVGVFALFIDALTAKHLSAAFIVLGVMGICISHYDHKKEGYAEVGKKLTLLFHRLREIYYGAKSAQDDDLVRFEQQLEAIEKEFSDMGMNDQILLSDWYAHYKFFWQFQIEWVDEQKKFRFFRDKVPLSLLVTIALIVIAILACLVIGYIGGSQTPKPAF